MSTYRVVERAVDPDRGTETFAVIQVGLSQNEAVIAAGQMYWDRKPWHYYVIQSESTPKHHCDKAFAF